MSVTLTPTTSIYSPLYSRYNSVYSPVSSVISPTYNSVYSPVSSVYSPVSSVYSVTTNSMPYVKTSLPVNTTQDIVVTSDYPLMLNRDKNQNLAISPLYPYMYPYTAPSVVIPYENLNKNQDVIKRLVKYFYYKTLDKWLYEDLNGLLRYFKISGGKIHIIKSENDKDKENISQEDVDLKIEYVEKEIFDKDDMYDILMKITNETDIELIKLPKNEYIVMGYVKKFLKKELQQKMDK